MEIPSNTAQRTIFYSHFTYEYSLINTNILDEYALGKRTIKSSNSVPIHSTLHCPDAAKISLLEARADLKWVHWGDIACCTVLSMPEKYPS